MEPSLQPSYSFPSRHKIANLAEGLRLVANSNFNIISAPKYASNINLETSLNPSSTVPPVMQLTTLDYQGRLPVSEPIYVQPGLAEGMSSLATLTSTEDDAMKTLSANNALKRGNVVAAEHILGRPATVEEISNKTITPNIRSNEEGTVNYHLNTNTSNLMSPANPDVLAARETSIKQLGAQLDEIAKEHNIDKQTVLEIKSRYNLVYPNSQRKSTDPGAWERGVDALKRAVVYERNRQNNTYSSHPDAGNTVMANMKGGGLSSVHQAKHMRGGDLKTYEESARKLGELKDRIRNIKYSMEAGPKFSYKGSDGDSGAGTGTDTIENETVDLDADPTEQENASIGATPNGQPLTTEDNTAMRPNVPQLPSGNKGAQPQTMNAEAVANSINIAVPIDHLPVETRVATDSINNDPEFANHQRKRALDTLHFFRSVNEKPKTPSINLKAPLPITMTARELMAPNSETDPLPSNEQQMQASIGSKRKAPKRKAMHMKGGDTNRRFFIDADGIYPEGAPFTAKLMRSTGNEARAMSGQIQVTEQHVLSEPSVKQFTRMPNVTEDLLSEIIKPAPLQSTQQETKVTNKAKTVGLMEAPKKVPIGRYHMNYSQFLHNKLLSITDSRGKKVAGLPNMTLGGNVHRALHELMHGGRVKRKMNKEDNHQLAYILQRTGASSDGLPEVGAAVNRSPLEEIKIVLGEIDAGNNSSALVKQLRTLLKYCRTQGLLDESHISSIAEEYLSSKK